jgi:demethylmenaquinone methyltransferase/2-methoxy-6-polyprenyl-1,4-benzoquinol methylase
LDAGCGIGLQALLLAEAIGPAGQVIGLDLDPELVAYGNVQVSGLGWANRVSLRQGNVKCLPFGNACFDWVWSADCVGYPLGELPLQLKELIRVVKPGGSIILLGWSSQQLLPGYPLLEARLNATCSGYAPYFKSKGAELHFLRAMHWFQAAGLQEVTAKTFVGQVQAPLQPAQRTALSSLLEMLWGEPQPEVTPEDWVQFERLCKPGAPNFILDLPDYYAFFTYSMFRGQVPLG